MANEGFKEDLIQIAATSLVTILSIFHICGIIASTLSAVPLFFQDDLWPWQLFITAIIVTIALIIPGHLFRRYVRKSYK